MVHYNVLLTFFEAANMEQSTTSRSFEYHVVAVTQNSGEHQVDAVRRIVKEMAGKEWEPVEACGDEIRMPSLIFVKSPGATAEDYLVEQVPHVKGHGEVDDVRETLWKRHDEGWRVLTVLDSPMSPPVGVYKKDAKLSAADSLKVVLIPVSITKSNADTIKREILEQEFHTKCKLQSVMHSGLSPVLILLSQEGAPDTEYLVEHAHGGIFSNQTKKLQEIIDVRAKEGWTICAAFEDVTLFPCVVFCRNVTQAET